jgi:hypothetical protein
MDIPPDGRPAADRYNNPGGAYPSKKFEKYGMEGYGILRNPTTGRTDPIGRYPTLANGIAANIAHLKSMPIVGKTVGQARHYWVYGNFNGSKSLTGLNSNQVITQELLNDPNWLAQWMRATAGDEGFGNKGRKIDDASLNQAFAILKNNANLEPSVQYAGNTQPPESGSKVAKSAAPNAAPNAGAENSTTPPQTTDYEKNAKIAEIAKDESLSPEEKQSAFQKILQQVEDSPFVADIKSKIKDIYSKGITKDTALQAAKAATDYGASLLKQYSKPS